MPYEQLKLSNQLCFPLYAGAKRIVALYKPFLDPLGLTYTQYIAMMALWEQDGVTMTTLGDRLFLDSGTLTPLIRKLEASGYVTKERSHEDERTVVIRLTERGRLLEDEAAGIPEKMAGCIHLPKEDMKNLYQILYRILA